MVSLSSLVSAFGGTLGGSGEVDVRDVRLDSRSVSAGDLFAALPGAEADGTRFVPDAVRRGAVAVLAVDPDDANQTGSLEWGAEGPRPLWRHPEARRVAGEAAALVHGHPARDMAVVAITGTNGKTTVASLVGQLFERAGLRPAVLGTVGYRVAGSEEPAPTTTPDAATLQRLLARHRAGGGASCVLEASSHGLVQHRLAGLPVDVAVFTNLSRDHLDYHRTTEQYAAAKALLFSGLEPNKVAVLNADDEASSTMRAAAESAGAEIVTYSVRSRADLVAVRWKVARQGTQLFLKGMGFPRSELFLPLLGRHNVENALAATAAVLRSGVSPSDAFEGLASAVPPPGRLEPVQGTGGDLSFTVLVDYAHTPAALESTLVAVREILRAEGRGRSICVFGCGGDRDRGKRPQMGAVVGRLADIALVTSDNPRSEDPDRIVADVLPGLSGAAAMVESRTDRREAIARAVEMAQPGDIVVVAGKGHETGQITSSGVRPFDDRTVVREALT